MIDSEIEYLLIDIEAISELFKVYVDNNTEDLNPGCLNFLSENLQKKHKKNQ